MIHRLYRLAAIMLGAALLPTVSGCQQPVDTQHIQDYAKTFAAGSAAFDAVAQDFAVTCVDIRELTETSVTYLRSAPVAAMTPIPSPNPGSGPTEGPAAQESASICATAGLVAQQWKLRNQILEAYVHALAAIAGVDTQPTGVDSLASALVSVQVISSGQTSAFTDLVNSIISIKLEGDRDAEIRKTVSAADKALQSATAALIGVTNDDYTTLLRDDLVEVDKLYRDHIRQELKHKYDRLAILRERQAWLAARVDIQNRETKAAAYASAMQELALMHSDLVKADAANASLSDIVNIVNAHVVPLLKDVTILTTTGK